MSDPQRYTVGWICALSTEYVAARAFLDERHAGPLNVSTNDNNEYTLGRVGQHNVVLAVAPDGEYGTQSAATVARDMLHSFPNVRIGLMVGIAGGAPGPKHDLRLGDIVVSAPSHGKGGVLQYDFGKERQGQAFEKTGFLNQPPPLLRAAVAGLRAHYEENGNQINEAISAMLDQTPRLQRKYRQPDMSTDRLYLSGIVHPVHDERECDAACDTSIENLVLRKPRNTDDDYPAVHYGLIASGNRVMKDALVRDAAAIDGILCFEMEAAGLMNHFPCLVIRGICDYSDSHKNKVWQGYAAMAAVAYAKDLLHRIHVNSVEAEKKLIDVVSGLQTSVAEVSQHMSELIHARRSEEDEIILNWITTIDFAPQQRDFIKQRQEGTGQWFLKSKEYKSWLAAPGQTLFCPGIPGAGKTILASTIIDNLSKCFGNDLSVAVVYAFCDFRRQEEQSPQELLCSFLKQLVSQKPRMPENIRKLYQVYRPKRQNPSVVEITATLHSAAADYSRLFLVIDALDEFRTINGGRNELLSGIFDFQTNTEANILVTSRYNEDIEAHLRNAPSLRIHATDQDVEKYLDKDMRFLRTDILDDEMRCMIKREIISAADGMFLLARLRMSMLVDMPTKGHLKHALKALSATGNQLRDIYEQALTRIAAQSQEIRNLAMYTLSWISHARRPLSPEELKHALAVQFDTHEMDTDYLPSTKLLLSICVGLITIDQDSDIVRLVHYSTQEYFELEEIQARWFPEAEMNIASICVTYLSYNSFTGFCPTDLEYKRRLDENPLYLYAASNWGFHIQLASTYCDRVTDFLENEDCVEASSQALIIGRQVSVSGFSQQAPKRMTGLHLAAYFGVEKAAIQLLDQSRDVNVRDNHGRTPLWWAAQHGHTSLIRVLVARGSVLDLQDKYGKTPLSRAAEKGHEGAVALLLERGAKVCSKDGRNWTPLLLAARQGHSNVVEILANSGASIEAKDSTHGRTPLWWAVENMHETTAKLLTIRGADFEIQDHSGDTMLCWAAKTGRERVVRLLLELGANPKVRNMDGRSPLSLAAGRGLADMVRQLIATSQVELESTDGSGRTPLSYAAESGHEEVVRLLLETGEIKLGLKWFLATRQHPLAMALENRHRTIAWLLYNARNDLAATQQLQHHMRKYWRSSYLGYTREPKQKLRKLIEKERRYMEARLGSQMQLEDNIVGEYRLHLISSDGKGREVYHEEITADEDEDDLDEAEPLTATNLRLFDEADSELVRESRFCENAIQFERTTPLDVSKLPDKATLPDEWEGGMHHPTMVLDEASLPLLIILNYTFR